MNKAVDFNTIRKRRQRTVAIKRLIALAGIMLLIAAVLFLNNLLVEVSITTKISDFFNGFGGPGYPVPAPGGEIRDVRGIGGDLAILCDNGVYVYNASGKTIQTIPQMSASAVMLTAPSRLFVYTTGGKSFGVYSRSKLVREAETEYPITGAAINDSGDWVILTSDKKYLSKAQVCNSRGEEIYSWCSSEFMAAAALSPSGDKLAVACVRTEGGVLRSQLNLFQIGVDHVAARAELPDELVLNIRYENDGRIFVLTDRSLYLYDFSGDRKKSYELGGKLLQFDVRDRETLLLIGNEEGNGQRLVLLDAELKPLADESQTERVLSVRLGRDTVYVLRRDGIAALSKTLAEKSFFDQTGITNIGLSGNRLYYFTSEEICVLGGQAVSGSA